MGDDGIDELEGFADALLPRHVRKSLLAGSIGGLTTTIVLAPLGVIKTRVQARSLTVGSAVRGILQTSGVIGFWSGARVGLLQTVPSNTIYMGTYEAILKEARTVPQLDYFSPAISGALARSLTVTVMAPMELIRTRQMGGNLNSMTQMIRDTIRSEGVRGLYRGWSSTVLRDSIFSAVYWLGFESLKPYYLSRVQQYWSTPAPADSSSSSSSSTCGSGDFWGSLRAPLATFAAGSSAGVVAAVLTHPFDLLKTRIQVRGLHEGVVPSISTIKHDYACKHCSTTALTSRAKLQCMATYVNELLFKGLPLRLAMIIPGAGIMITVYETVKQLDI